MSTLREIANQIRPSMPAAQPRPQAGADYTSWWDPADPEGSVSRLTAGRPVTSESIRGLAPYLEPLGGRVENANAAGVTSKIYLPGMSNATRIANHLDTPGATPTFGYVPQPGTEGGRSLAGMGNWQAGMDPSYAFRVGEGQQALERSAAAKGTLLTGGTAAALNRYGQDYASTEFGNIFGRNLSLAQLGQNATQSLAGAGSSYSRAAGDEMTDIGTAQSAGTATQGAATGNTLATIGNAGLDLYNKWKTRPKKTAATALATSAPVTATGF